MQMARLATHMLQTFDLLCLKLVVKDIHRQPLTKCGWQRRQVFSLKEMRAVVKVSGVETAQQPLVGPAGRCISKGAVQIQRGAGIVIRTVQLLNGVAPFLRPVKLSLPTHSDLGSTASSSAGLGLAGQFRRRECYPSLHCRLCSRFPKELTTTCCGHFFCYE